MPNRNHWHILRSEGQVTVARRLPLRFDLRVESRFPSLRKTRLALQIRQDLWRRLQRQRGFSPVVAVSEMPGGLRVSAGGQVDARFNRALLEARILELLSDPALRARWCRFAALKEDLNAAP